MKNIINLLILKIRNMQRILDKHQEFQAMETEELLVPKRITLKAKLEIAMLISLRYIKLEDSPTTFHRPAYKTMLRLE